MNWVRWSTSSLVIGNFLKCSKYSKLNQSVFKKNLIFTTSSFLSPLTKENSEKSISIEDVSPFCSLHLDDRNDCTSINVRSLDPHVHKNQQHIQLSGSHVLNYEIQKVSESLVKINSGIQKSHSNNNIEILLPMKNSLITKLLNGKIAVSNLENLLTEIQFIKAECKLSKLKSEKIRLRGEQCSLNADSLHGDLMVTCSQAGKIDIKKLVGNVLNVRAQDCSLNLESLYCEKSDIEANSGDITIGSCHNNTNIKLNKGKLKIDSLDGSINVNINKGSLKMFIMNHQNVNIQLQSGDIELGLLENRTSEFTVESKHLEIDEKLTDQSSLEKSTEKNWEQCKGILNVKNQNKECGSSIKVFAPNGTVKVLAKDWFSSLNLIAKN